MSKEQELVIVKLPREAAELADQLIRVLQDGRAALINENGNPDASIAIAILAHAIGAIVSATANNKTGEGMPLKVVMEIVEDNVPLGIERQLQMQKLSQSLQ